MLMVSSFFIPRFLFLKLDVDVDFFFFGVFKDAMRLFLIL